ncbi:hypothetical protein D3C76_1713620 [compost metagenome]
MFALTTRKTLLYSVQGRMVSVNAADTMEGTMYQVELRNTQGKDNDAFQRHFENIIKNFDGLYSMLWVFSLDAGSVNTCSAGGERARYHAV